MVNKEFNVKVMSTIATWAPPDYVCVLVQVEVEVDENGHIAAAQPALQQQQATAASVEDAAAYA